MPTAVAVIMQLKKILVSFLRPSSKTCLSAVMESLPHWPIMTMLGFASLILLM